MTMRLAAVGLVAAIAAASGDADVRLVVDTTTPIAQVDQREVSVTWDIYALQPGPMERKAPFDLADPFLRGLVANLQPFVLRISGTGCENVIFGNSTRTVPEGVIKVLRPGGGGTAPFNARPSDWDQVVAFANATGAEMVVGLNMLLRKWPHSGGEGGCGGVGEAGCLWDSTNARAWIEHNRDVGAPIYGYELGNEPGCFMPEVNLTGDMAAADFGSLKGLLGEVYSDGRTPMVLGPDVGGCWKGGQGPRSIEPILSHRPPVDIITFHHYVLPGSTKNGHGVYTPAQFAAAALSNITRSTVDSYAAAQHAYMPSTPMWLGEGATTYSQPLDNSFASLYNFIGILSETGRAGVSVFAKQSLSDLLPPASGPNHVAPTPPFWAALLWKRLMGQRVLAVEALQGDGTGNADVNSVVVAGRSRKDGNPGAAVALVNLAATARTISLAPRSQDGNTATPSLSRTQVAGSACEVYVLAAVGNASGTELTVNGAAPAVDATTGKVPAILPRTLPNCDAVLVPPSTMAFVVLRS